MEQIVVQVQDKYKAKILFELLTALDFVDVVSASEQANESAQIRGTEDTEDFFSFAGLWANRDITLRSIRQLAWQRQYS